MMTEGDDADDANVAVCVCPTELSTALVKAMPVCIWAAELTTTMMMKVMMLMMAYRDYDDRRR